MRKELPLAKQFRAPQKNHRQNLLFNILITTLLLIVLTAILTPSFLKLITFLGSAVTNFKINIAPNPGAALNPIVPNLRDTISARADKSIFEPKDYQDIDAYTLQVSDRTGLVVLFGKNGNINEQLSSLQSLLSKSRIESRVLVKVDLRFNKIAVEYDTSK